MSISAALNVALTGLQASTTAAQIISGNVANAQTQGYTQKTINLEPITGGASLGGVEISGYSRVSNSVLSATLNGSTSSASYYSAQNSYLSQIQTMLDSTDTPPALSDELSKFEASWIQYAGNPSDSTLQATLISTGEQFASLVQTISTSAATLQTNVQSDLSTSVGGLNTALAKVQTLNTDITTAMSNNQPIVDLQDERDQAINKVAQYTNVQIMQRANGQVALYTANGTALIDGQAQVFSVGSAVDGSPAVVNSAGANVSACLAGGSLQAETDFLSLSPTTANGSGVATKLQSQLQNFSNMFLATTSSGKSFADVYNAAYEAANATATPVPFFTATIDPATGLPDLTTFQVNSALSSGTSTVPSSSANAVAATFSTPGLAISCANSNPANPAAGVWIYSLSSSFTANNGLMTLQNQTYSGVATAILSGFQQAANAIQTQYETASTQQAYYRSSLSSQTGVNTDTELINLTNWENSYAASAHVISTIQSMMKTLEDMVA